MGKGRKDRKHGPYRLLAARQLSFVCSGCCSEDLRRLRGGQRRALADSQGKGACGDQGSSLTYSVCGTNFAIGQVTVTDMGSTVYVDGHVQRVS